jgi:hypothetical protein
VEFIASSRGPEGGCSQSDLRGTGGNGLFYCFAPPMPNAIRGTYTVSGIVPGLDGKQPKYRLGQRIGKNSWLGEHADAGPPREFIVRKDGRIPQPIRGAAGATVGFWRIGTAVPRRLPDTRVMAVGCPRKREKAVPGKTFRV